MIEKITEDNFVYADIRNKVNELVVEINRIADQLENLYRKVHQLDVGDE